MFENLFTYPKVVARHHDGPDTSKRLRYLKHLSDQRAARETLPPRPASCWSLRSGWTCPAQVRHAGLDRRGRSILGPIPARAKQSLR